MRIESAGRRDTRVTFWQPTTTRDAQGGLNASFADAGARLAKVLWGSSAERRETAVEGAVQTATFRVLADTLTRLVTTEWQIRCTRMGVALTFDVTGFVPIGADEIEFTATASREAS